MIASNETFVIAAYALTWLALLGYALRLASKGGRARADQARVGGSAGDPR